MSEKKYSIVRVDNRCPVEEEEDIYLIDRIKMFPCFNDKRLSCKKCNYGDTKEQMILKVAQVLIKDEMKYCKWETKVQKEVCWQNNMELAKEIVEFLGVK